MWGHRRHNKGLGTFGLPCSGNSTHAKWTKSLWKQTCAKTYCTEPRWPKPSSSSRNVPKLTLLLSTWNTIMNLIFAALFWWTFLNFPSQRSTVKKKSALMDLSHKQSPPVFPHFVLLGWLNDPNRCRCCWCSWWWFSKPHYVQRELQQNH